MQYVWSSAQIDAPGSAAEGRAEFICKCNYFVLSFIYNFMSARTIRLVLAY